MSMPSGDFNRVQNQKKHGLDDQLGEDFSPPRKTCKKDQSIENEQLGTKNDTQCFGRVLSGGASHENINENHLQQSDNQQENVLRREPVYGDPSPDEVQVVESTGATINCETGNDEGNKCTQEIGTVNSKDIIISTPEAQAPHVPVIVYHKSKHSTGTEASIDKDKTFADISTIRAVIQWIDRRYPYTPTKQKQMTESLKNIILSEKLQFLEEMKNSGKLNESQYNELVDELSCQSPATIETNTTIVNTGQGGTQAEPSSAFNTAEESRNGLVRKNPLARPSSSLQESIKQVQQQPDNQDGGDFYPSIKLASTKMSDSGQVMGATLCVQKETHLSKGTGLCYNKNWRFPFQFEVITLDDDDMESNQPMANSTEEEVNPPESASHLNTEEEYRNNLVDVNHSIAGSLSSSLVLTTEDGQQEVTNPTVANSTIHVPEAVSAIAFNNGKQHMMESASENPLPYPASSSELITQGGQQEDEEPSGKSIEKYINSAHQNVLSSESNQPGANSTEQEIQPVAASDLSTEEESRNDFDNVNSPAPSLSSIIDRINEIFQQEVTNPTVANSTIHAAEAVSAIPLNNGEQDRSDLVSENALLGPPSSFGLITQGRQQERLITHGQQEQHLNSDIENSNSPSQGHLPNNATPGPSNVEHPVNTFPQMEHEQELTSDDKVIMDQFWNDVYEKAVLRKAYAKMNQVKDRKNKIRAGGIVFVDLTFPEREILHANVSGKKSPYNPNRNKYNEERVETISKILAWLLEKPTNITMAAFTEYKRTNNLGLQGDEYLIHYWNGVLSTYAHQRRSQLLKGI